MQNTRKHTSQKGAKFCAPTDALQVRLFRPLVGAEYFPPVHPVREEGETGKVGVHQDAYNYLFLLAQLSRNPTIRLKTGLPGSDSS